MDISDDAPGWCRCSSIHTERDKSRLEMAELFGSREAAASQSRMTCDLDSPESAAFCGKSFPGRAWSRAAPILATLHCLATPLA